MRLPTGENMVTQKRDHATRPGAQQKGRLGGPAKRKARYRI
jgi:hypothetical protein